MTPGGPPMDKATVLEGLDHGFQEHESEKTSGSVSLGQDQNQHGSEFSLGA